MPRYQIEETAVYYVEAVSPEQAEELFLNAILLRPESGITCEVPDREVSLVDLSA